MPLTDLRHAAPAGWLLALLLAPAVTLAAGPWPAVAREDLAFVQASLRDNHPGAIDEENPDFRVWLEQGYRQALDLAGRAESLEDAVAAVRFYIAGFADGHTSFSPAYQPLFVRWPGFVLVRRGGAVHGPPRGVTGGSIPPGSGRGDHGVRWAAAG